MNNSEAYEYLKAKRPLLLIRAVEIGSIITCGDQNIAKPDLAAQVEKAVVQVLAESFLKEESKTTNAAFDEQCVSAVHRERRALKNNIIKWLRDGSDPGRGLVAWDETVGAIRNELADIIEKNVWYTSEPSK